MTSRRRRIPRGYKQTVATFDDTGVVTVRSGLEADVLDDLTLRGQDWEYEPETMEYTITHKYTPDLKLVDATGHTFYVEIKGWFQAKDRTKLLQVRKEHPEKDIRLVFENASSFISPKSRTRNKEWAKKHGFLWAETRVPSWWLKGRKDVPDGD